jgi:peptidoglycan LD-endopeptidase CwlK
MNKSIEMRVYYTVRDPFEQGKLWRQSRSTEEINAKLKELKNSGANFLANCIESVGKQYGEHVTNAIPGLSWHQWGEAIDSVWIVNKEAEWSTKVKVNGVNGYVIYANEAINLGLDAGHYWTKIKDSPHVQLSSLASPLKRFSLVDIDREMKRRFS